MKTVKEAVDQENGVWRFEGCNAMAFLMGDIDYCSIDDSGQLYHGDVNDLSEPMCDNWQLVCTREEFEAEVKRRENIKKYGTEYAPEDVAFKSKEWDGGGIPPVGCECEFRAKGGSMNNGSQIEWHRCCVEHISRHYAIIRLIGDQYSDTHEATYVLRDIEFRPLKTPTTAQHNEDTELKSKICASYPEEDVNENPTL